MAAYRDGLKHPTAIWEAAMMHYTVQVICTARGCNHAAVFDPHGLWQYFTVRDWDQAFRLAQQRFWCRPCSEQAREKVKRAVMQPSRNNVTDHRFPMPNERDWKRFVSRHRG